MSLSTDPESPSDHSSCYSYVSCMTYNVEPICVVSHKTLDITRLGAELGFRHVESHFGYVYHTLTREISVFKKVTV